ncbi:alpha beta hydrolase fold protein [Colletotrichum truncatum]|uniref:Alpha beta hydrolase fold protein n=1 Tax=Colletotrichum truncatum TaxID=5467 RepID=A0ACC3YF55_COLTU|nr:alpha beta hydrolase fold protein [Colletotrichum truncatum]KAF6785002.1 alpha beta hydrolase fold protein [Colletotrichum truncatum]
MADDQNNTTTSNPSGSLLIEQAPLLSMLRYGATAYAIQNLVVKPAMFLRDIKAHVIPPEHRPDFVKTYECRPNLPVRIFFPKCFDKTSKNTLPVLFTIHGGGFVLGTPNDNDDWNAIYASLHHSIVIGLNYAKAPGNPFPGPIYDCEELFLAALKDESLPLDRTRVSLAGWSAGGNLCLAVSQREAVKKHLSAIVPMYPCVDLSIPSEEKAKARRYKPDLGGFRSKDRDMLLGMAPVFDWSYKVPGDNARNPLLSPAYAPKEALPKQIFMIGCELDLLAHEAQVLIHKLAGRPAPPAIVGKEEAAGKGELILDDERFHFEVSNTDGSRYKWLLVPDTIHGFDQNIGGLVRDPVLMEDAEIKIQKTIKIIGEWVLQAPPTTAS